MGFITILTADRNATGTIQGPLGELLGHNSHMDGVVETARTINGVTLVATVHSSETALLDLGPDGDSVTFRTGVTEVGKYATPVPARDQLPTAGAMDTRPDAPTFAPSWTGMHLERVLAANNGVFDPTVKGVDVPAPEWPTGPGRFVIGIREEATRDTFDPNAVADAVRQVIASATLPWEARIGSWSNAVFAIGFLPEGASTVLVADRNICLAASVIADTSPDWWTDIGSRLR
jgi:hypothetical protein